MEKGLVASKDVVPRAFGSLPDPQPAPLELRPKKLSPSFWAAESVSGSPCWLEGLLSQCRGLALPLLSPR